MSEDTVGLGDDLNNPEGSLEPVSKINGDVEEPEKCLFKQEKELLNKIAEYETSLEQEKSKNISLKNELQICAEEKENLKAQVLKLEKELARHSLKGAKDQDTDPNDMVTKAKSVIFEKTKMCKNQELQIEALTQQVKSLKEITSISKDMLDIRNIEVKQLQDHLHCLEVKFATEKDHRGLMHDKLEKMIKLNEELKKEYKTQFELFTELKTAYANKQKLLESSNQQKVINSE